MVPFRRSLLFKIMEFGLKSATTYVIFRFLITRLNAREMMMDACNAYGNLHQDWHAPLDASGIVVEIYDVIASCA